MVVSGLVGYTSAIFGRGANGLAVINNWPGITFNSYWSSSGAKSLSSGYCGSMWVSPTNGQMEWRTGTNAGSADASVSHTVRMVLLNDGRVGIGDETPSEKLEVNGDVKADTVKSNVVTVGSYGILREVPSPTRVEVVGNFGVTLDTYLGGNLEVGGKIYADSLNVDAVVINDWLLEVPDYVFEPVYKLRSLADVEKHVKTHKRLPDMPVTAESKGKSVDLAALNMALLKKVEELTLYAIEQDKKIAALQRKVERQ